MLWCYGKLAASDFEWLPTHVAPLLLQDVEHLKDSDLVRLTQGLGWFRFYNATLLQLIAVQVRQGIGRLKPMDVASLLAAFAKQRFFPEDLFRAVDDGANTLLKRSQSKVLQTMRLVTSAYGLFGI